MVLDTVLDSCTMLIEGNGSHLIRVLREVTPAASTIPARPSFFYLDVEKDRDDDSHCDSTTSAASLRRLTS